MARGRVERDAAQDRPAGIIGELDVLEPDRAGAHLQWLRPGKVFDLGILRQDGEHRLDVDDRLLDVAIDHPHEIERLVELQHDQIHQHKGADGLRSIPHLGDAHHQNHDQTEGENDRLTGVERRQRDVGSHAHALISRHRLVVSRGLSLFGAEILHRLKVEQTVDRLGIGVRVALVHRTANADAPIGGQRRKCQISDHREADRHDVAPVERDQHRGDNQRELDDGRNRGQHRGANDGLDGVAAALENAREPAGLALQMKTQRQAMQVLEYFDRQSAHRVHGDGREQRVAPLLGQRHDDAQDPIEDGQRNRAEKNARQRDRVECKLAGDRVCGPLVGVGNCDREQLGEQHQGDGEKHAQLQISAVRRPDVRP